MRLLMVVFAALMSGCAGVGIQTVMDECPKRMPAYVDCVKDRYSSEGKSPNSSDVQGMWLEFAAIKESFVAGKIGEAEAIAEANRAYRRLILGEGTPQVNVIRFDN